MIQGFFWGSLGKLIGLTDESLAMIRRLLPAGRGRGCSQAQDNPKQPAPHDTEKYQWRNLIERLFNKLKNWRCIATRDDRTKESCLGFVAIAAVWL